MNNLIYFREVRGQVWAWLLVMIGDRAARSRDRRLLTPTVEGKGKGGGSVHAAYHTSPMVC